ncbi:facilitated trehalose transporter Tret1-like [Diorhabda sublineata]|uniref:facilitated trehalose transporter Tret1-like n=1 Tax=Diorhabda sublineata TaxID=1163346 RepID=UPI0024E09FE9|nr:facilitated trehalose transporter Tret1-like [Diorhabda sublineata]
MLSILDFGDTWPQYMAVMTALIAMVNAGIHFAWPSPSLPKIMSDEYKFEITSEEASYITIIGPCGDILGSILYPALVDRIGRKKTILLIAVPQIISMGMIYFSFYSKVLLYFARLIGGLAEAGCFTTLPLYIGEVSEPQVRGVLGSLFSLVFIIGVFTVNSIGSYVTIHTAALVFLVLPIIFVLLFSRMPESPYYYIMKSKFDEAEHCLKDLRRKDQVDRELQCLINDVNRQMSEPGRYQDLYQIQSNRIACIVMFGLRIIQQLSGTSAISLYMQIIFNKSTNILSKDLASIFIFGLQLSVNLTAVFIVDKIGRKPLLTISCIGCSLPLFIMAVFFVLQDYSSYDLSDLNYIPLVGIVIFTIAFAIGQGNVVNLMIGEMFSSSIKAKASCLMNILFAIFMILTTKLFQLTSDHVGMYVPFFFFAFCQVGGAAFSYLVVPETKGKSLEEIQQKLKKK